MMTSLMAVSNTSLATTKTSTVLPEKANAIASSATTFSPITDITEKTSARASAAPPPPSLITTNNSISKIPYPLGTVPPHKTLNQFARSGSLRMRGAKSNLLCNDTFNNSKKNHCNNNNSSIRTGHTYNMETEQVNDVNTRNEVHHGTHEFSPTGRVSPRRKLVLTSLNPTVGLTRSLSLRRNHKSSYKTELHKETQCELAECSRNDLPHKDIGERELAGAMNEVSLVNGVSVEKTENAALNESPTEVSPPGGSNNKQKLHGTSATTPAATATPVRPATLATGNGTAKSTPATTPTTHTHSKHPLLHPHPSHHPHHSLHCTKQHLASVPETKLTPKTPPVTPDSPSTYLDDDLDSMYSFATTTSGRSTMSCEHPYVARNGTTFSGRKMKYVVHCSNHAGQVGPDYLTPTQRATRQIRRLKELLCVARQDLEQKDSEILRLTREVVELRLFKASLSPPEERSASSDAVTVREAELKTSQDVSPIVDMVDEAAAKSSPRHIVQHGVCHHTMQLSSEMQSSFADSGHFEDMTSSSVHSKDSYAAPHMHDIACGSDEVCGDDCEASVGENYELQRQELIRLYEQRIEELLRTQDAAASEMKRSHNDKVEALLQKLAECNTRYADIVPDYEHAKERIRELERQLEDLQRKLAEHEEKQNKMYLHMYQKGQEAERIARADQALELAHRAPNNKVSINELLHQLQSTQDELENIRAAECRNECGSNHALLTAKEAISLWVLGARKTIYRRLMEAQKNRTHVDPEVTLQFLKSAVYYFLTDKENSQGHLQAIESILEFTEAEKQNITKARTPK